MWVHKQGLYAQRKEVVSQKIMFNILFIHGSNRETCPYTVHLRSEPKVRHTLWGRVSVLLPSTKR
jgi:hypothetical protein